MYERVTADLRLSYDGAAAQREASAAEPWKEEERWRFLEMLRREGKTRLLEVGAGTGLHGKFFQDQGIQVVATDLGAENVKLCQAKGLEAYQRDFLHLGFPESSFDALFAMNCLLHVPRRDLDDVLRVLERVLSPGGLFYLGQHGGVAVEGRSEEDSYEPKRFFSELTDDDLREAAWHYFEEVDFRLVDLNHQCGQHFQTLTLRKRTQSRPGPNVDGAVASRSFDRPPDD